MVVKANSDASSTKKNKTMKNLEGVKGPAKEKRKKTDTEVVAVALVFGIHYF